jgi:tetratricopeptide (TPR) repeat protein
MLLMKSAHDVRIRTLLVTGGLIIAGGLAISWLPEKFQTSVTKGQSEDRAVHALKKREEEINRRFEQGVALLNEKQYEPALKEFHRVIELSPTMPEAHVNAGFALLGQKRYDMARDFFEGAISLRKNQLNAYFGLAEAFAGLNDLQGALGTMRIYLHLSPPDDPYRSKAEVVMREWSEKIKKRQD